MSNIKDEHVIEGILSQMYAQQLDEQVGFGQIFEMLNPYLWRVIRNAVDELSEEEIADVAADTWLSIWEHFKQFDLDHDSHASFKTWASTIAHNKAIDYIRRQNTKRKAIDKLHSEEVVRIATATLLEEMIIRQHDDLDEVLWRLDKEDALILAYRYYRELKYNRIAEITGLTEKAVQGRFYRAQAKAADILTIIRPSGAV